MKPFPTSAACCFGILFISVSLKTTGSSEVQVVGSADTVFALAGDDVILPCSLKPNVSAEDMAVEWTELNGTSKNVHLYRDGRDSNEEQHPSYRRRTSLFNEELKNGNVSLKLTRVTLSDAGSYRCFIPTLTSQVKETTVQLFVGAVSLPVISIDGTKGWGVVLKCESGGWFPEPEMEWLDSSGSILPADGPPERHSDSEDLYTVRQHVTVNQTDTNRFTCRVNQTEINHKKETEIYVPDDLFPKGGPKSHVGLIVGLLITAVVLLAASAGGVYIWRKHKDFKFPKSPMWWIVLLLIAAAVVLAAFAGVYLQRELEDEVFPKSHVVLIVGLSIAAAVVVLSALAVGVYMWRKHTDEVFPKSRMWWIVLLLIAAALVLAAFAGVYLQRELEDQVFPKSPKGGPESHVGLIVGLLIAAAVGVLAASAGGVYIWRKHKASTIQFDPFRKENDRLIKQNASTIQIGASAEEDPSPHCFRRLMDCFRRLMGASAEEDPSPQEVRMLNEEVRMQSDEAITEREEVRMQSAPSTMLNASTIQIGASAEEDPSPPSTIQIASTIQIGASAEEDPSPRASAEEDPSPRASAEEDPSPHCFRRLMASTIQIDEVTRERDELKEQLRKAEVTIKTLSTSPGGQQKTQTPSQKGMEMKPLLGPGMEMKPLLGQKDDLDEMERGGRVTTEVDYRAAVGLLQRDYNYRAELL